MSKFKAGDRVVVVKNNHPGQGNYHLGTRGEVSSASNAKEYEVGVLLDSGKHFNFDSDELELESVYDALSAEPVEETSLAVGVVDSRPEDVDMVASPPHYTSHPSGIQPIQITRYHDFVTGNVLKYVMRAPYKGTEVQDLKKAAQYLQWAIEDAEGRV
jgi:hypothetical protein